jgi:Glycosyltransferase family 92
MNIASVCHRADCEILAVRELSHSARGWLRRIRRAGRQFSRAASVAVEEYRIRHELTACMKFKNAAQYLPEWIEFHQIVGFEHFYLYNNNSTDDYVEALAPYRDERSVTLHEWPQTPAFPKADQHCVAHHRHEARWIAFLDDDEFLFPTRGENVRKILRRYEAYPAVAVHWLMFGSSGHLRRPEGLVLENYLRRAQDVHPNIKSIVNPRRIAAPANTHHWLYKNGNIACDENGQPVKTSHSIPATAEVLRINHYWSKSLEDGQNKVARGAVDEWTLKNPRSMKLWHEFDCRMNEVEDREILRFVPILKRRLEMRAQSHANPVTR